MRLPRRHDKTIVRREVAAFAVKVNCAVAFDHAIHRAVGAAIGVPVKALRQPLRERGHGGKHVTTGGGIGVTHFVAMRGMGRCMFRQLFQRGARAFIGEAQQRCAAGVVRVIYG